MMDLNQKIAKIDGKCQCERPLAKRKPYCGDCHHKHRPDYLASENRHELERIVEEKKIPITMENWHCKEWTVMMAVDTGLIAKHSTDLSIALAEAIVEAKG